MAATVVLTVSSLWADRFLPFERWMYMRLNPALEQPQPVPVAIDANTISVVQPQPIGTDSSLSGRPLPLILTATRLGRNASEGYADIGVNALSPQSYRAGALLANGARLQEIYADHVVLERNLQRVQLYLVGHTGPEAALPAAAAAILTVGGRPPAPLAVADTQDTLSTVMRVSPVYEGDALQSLEIYGGEKLETFTRLGLAAGDRLTAIDGVPVKNQAEAMNQLRQLLEGASLNVTIERGGKSQTLSLDGSLIRAAGVRG